MPVLASREFHKVFLGKTLGVGLSRRRARDPHVVFTILSEDEGNWFIAGREGVGLSSSTYLMQEMIDVLQEAFSWVCENCDPYLVGDETYGWKFKE